MRPKSTQAPKTRELLLEEAIRTIRAAGVHACTLNGVVRRIGKTHGGFYGHFSSRDAMVDAAVERMIESNRSRRVERAAAEDSPAQALMTFIDHYLSPEHRDDSIAGCVLPLLASEALRMPDGARQHYAAEAKSVREFIAVPLRARGGQQVDATATSLLAEMVGALCQARAEPDPLESGQILAASLTVVRQRSGLPFR
ncbi:TetR/AcrR family transcriptional regulator [Phenylobacterium sp.]|uniref:TetR/AcrR family transcriptional regulator n=1 Tax=Phenylobacterium sp. TaxID=1871053 RepID=UPI0027344437|nr:helix-turn-helix domain-containing protein [Phenylobacterium sp.]MDP3173056.1 helix-turn-helix domain-containing protein [Phenylobacterium sp.]MDP3659853.1 helix-turn-helix domain-containing protein [Phenylobacterium sp.]